VSHWCQLEGVFGNQRKDRKKMAYPGLSCFLEDTINPGYLAGIFKEN
jgi:hypothetical protein